MLEANPSGNFTSANHSQNFLFSSPCNVYNACGIVTRSPSCLKCNSFLKPKISRSRRELKLSLVLPGMFIKVQNMLSNIFFSICMTSRLWRSRRVTQYGNLKKMLYFVQFNSSVVRFLFRRDLPNCTSPSICS
ncbi:hypothetical protein CIPAW_16G057400 [Carya illinoinensis]|uniref:Uncharacterized protein n=1 Tax=Carya illinoinensis TaxID=32201 RepID=A0A8T1N606_CARIL|nr:hypothetical protein CIPAW_16G057400 [Carya illinoinensis]